MTTTENTKPATASEKAATELGYRAKEQCPWISVSGADEARIDRGLLSAGQFSKRPVVFWDCVRGLHGIDGAEIAPGKKLISPMGVLDYIEKTLERRMYVLHGFGVYLKDPAIQRALINLCKALPVVEDANHARTVVTTGHNVTLPEEIAEYAVAMRWPLPDRTEIDEILGDAIAPYEGITLVNGKREQAIDSVVGLSGLSIERSLARSIVERGVIDSALLVDDKSQEIKKVKGATMEKALVGGLGCVGGLENLKSWLLRRKAAFSKRAREFGVPRPKGVLLVGVPGCGKSLTSKAIASTWEMPLFAVDMAALKSSLVGSSEAQIRQLFAMLDALAPCVVRLDEIEKAFANAGQQLDGGVSSGFLGFFLSWMQDHESEVFVVATANDVSALPPEMLRKGRFDEIFFVDLPTATERAAILTAALEANKRPADGIDVAKVVTATVDFAGAEIAALVTEALYTAFADGERPIATADLVEAAKSTVPLSSTMKERIDSLRTWAKGRARLATAPEATATVATKRRRNLDV